MNKALPLLGLSCALAVPTLAQARTVTLSTDMASYYGKEAYLAFYVTDASGEYQQTLWVAGTRSKYYRSLRDWYRATHGNYSEVRGITGASVGSRRTMTVDVELADALINAGYQLHVDAAVEHSADSPSEVIIPLSDSNDGKAVSGTRYIKSVTVDF